MAATNAKEIIPPVRGEILITPDGSPTFRFITLIEDLVRFTQSNSAVIDISDQIDSSTAWITMFQNQIKLLKAQIAQLQAAIAILQGQVVALNARVTELEDEVNTLEVQQLLGTVALPLN